ncbi:MAG: zinc-dependent alcohol dehydrogenase family protein [Clostridia bacterium]|nr:zinc-dependent alcohol dehydrogenase family protein [Clostridia bacterium]
MKASFFMGLKTIKTMDVDTPEIGPREVLVRNKYCGVCGTDVHIYHGEPGSADVTPPVILGHEYAGVVEKVGSEITKLKVGDHVTIDPNIYCGQCIWCRTGKKQMCENMQALGVTMNGGFAEYCAVPEAQAFVVPKEVPFEYAAMTEPVACCLHGIDVANIKAGDNVVVIGGGAIGLIMMQLAKMTGAAKIVVSEPNEMRREVALKLGADMAVNPMEEGYVEKVNEFFGEPGADVIIECVGNNPAVSSAFAYAKKGATIVLFSVPKVGAEFNLNLFDVYKKELTIKGSFVNPDTHSRAVNIIASGRIDLGPIITHTFDVENLEDAIKMQMSNESIKVVVKA